MLKLPEIYSVEWEQKNLSHNSNIKQQQQQKNRYRCHNIGSNDIYFIQLCNNTVENIERDYYQYW